MPKFPLSFALGFATDQGSCASRSISCGSAAAGRSGSALDLAIFVSLPFTFRVQISRVLRRVRLSCCASVPMFPFSAALGSLRSCASCSVSCGTAAAGRQGRRLLLSLFACIPFSSLCSVRSPFAGFSLDAPVQTGGVSISLALRRALLWHPFLRVL